MNNAHVLARDLLEQIVAREDLMGAWQRVKANKGAAGCDEVPVPADLAWARQHWPTIKAELEAWNVLSKRGTPGIDPQSEWR